MKWWEKLILIVWSIVVFGCVGNYIEKSIPELLTSKADATILWRTTPPPVPPSSLLTETDLRNWKGSFKIAAGNGTDFSCLQSSGFSATYNPVNDSIVIMGGLNCKGYIAEYSIPTLVQTTNTASMNAATQLNSWGDLTGSFGPTIWDANGNTGVQYLPAQSGQATDKYCWVVYMYYNVNGTNYDSLGCSNTNFVSLSPQGLWHWNAFHAMSTSLYLTELNPTWVTANVPGQFLGGGRHREAGCCGSHFGPALYSVVPWSSSSWPANGSQQSSTAILYYPQAPVGYDKNGVPEGSLSFTDYTASDFIYGLADVSGTKSGTVFLLVKGYGAVVYGADNKIFQVVAGSLVGTPITRSGVATVVQGQTSGATANLDATFPGYHSPGTETAGPNTMTTSGTTMTSTAHNLVVGQYVTPTSGAQSGVLRSVDRVIDANSVQLNSAFPADIAVGVAWKTPITIHFTDISPGIPFQAGEVVQVLGDASKHFQLADVGVDGNGQGQGYHSDPYVPTLIAYDPSELVPGLHTIGSVQPYLIVSYPNGVIANAFQPGKLGGMAFARTGAHAGYLFVIQTEIDFSGGRVNYPVVIGICVDSALC